MDGTIIMIALRTAGLLFLSNLFMTAAWYGHLKFKNVSLIWAILISWGLAFFEYVLQVPANRLGYFGSMTGYQLKILQECIALIVFIGFAALFLGEGLSLRYGISIALIAAALVVAFY